MLVLTRKVGESIKVGDDIQFVILGYNRGEVKVGVEAPREVPIKRIESKDFPPNDDPME